MKKFVFNFKSKEFKKKEISKKILGGKGANLAEMGRLGLPVPPGFTISTEACDLFFKNKKKVNTKILKEINRELNNIEKDSKKLPIRISRQRTDDEQHLSDASFSSSRAGFRTFVSVTFGKLFLPSRYGGFCQMFLVQNLLREIS